MLQNTTDDIEEDLDNRKWYVELISPQKFIILFITSFGLYGVWWMYKSWKFFNEREIYNLMPAMRALFSIFFAYPLFVKIQNLALKNGYRKSYNSSLLFIGFVVCSFCAQLPSFVGILSIISFVFLIPPLKAFNFAVMNLKGHKGAVIKRYNVPQILIVCFGIIIWSLGILSTLLYYYS